MLVRSGIERLVLVDGDVFLPSNLERHILDWRDVGFRKAQAVKRRLLQIGPGAEVDVIDSNLNWQRSARTHARQIETIAECSLIVDATGDTPTALLLGAVAAENALAFVSVEVFEGGLGGVVARSVPDRDPPYVAGRAAYMSYCEQMNVRPPASGRRTYEALSENGEPLVADDVAATIAAAHAARVILDIVDERVDAAAMAWLLIGCRTGWLFKGHGHTISLDVGEPRPNANPTEDTEAQAFVLELARRAIDAAASSS
jgi:molybdopterin/thiamine biosynthesis adenylyltransferase